MTFASAQLVRRRVVLAAVPLLALIAVWALSHSVSLLGWASRDGETNGLAVAYAVTFALFVWQALMFFSDRPATVTDRQQRQLDELRVLVPVPNFNESPEALQSTVAAILAQARRPYMIYVVDDGSEQGSYDALLPWFMQACREAGVIGRWQRQDNGGKRSAQATALRETVDEHQIDVVWTVDSDARPDAQCLREGLKPLADPEVMTVTSVILTENTRDSTLARIMDLTMVSLQLTDRSAMSVAGAVLVNSGASAFYRAAVVLDNLDSYLNEKFFGREMKISDDSLLTLYGQIRGRTVQQPTSLVFTTMPHRFKGHWKQQTRWGRGSFIRSWWRMKYLPTNRFSYWWHLIRWSGFGINTVALLTVMVVDPLVTDRPASAYLKILTWSVIVQVCIGSSIMLRSFCIRRSDQSLAYQLGTFALAPLAVLWSATVLRANRWYSIFTCLNMGWQTRPDDEAPKNRPEHWLPPDQASTRIMDVRDMRRRVGPPPQPSPPPAWPLIPAQHGRHHTDDTQTRRVGPGQREAARR
ncbi:hyaluronan synthase [Actinoplanes lutulentus]|uniref:glycosyltransferase n=1 Tax=Actinoplanes lutulentus TaxID=1287878 RepID=UPI0015EC3701|nr:glycosyltransferase family 2 protein [Actinoplanes lutulentus]MBB2940499.1 hyaluronan synthase [Actinoplanes lutulentus]